VLQQWCLSQLGGTIGDIEGMPFIEAFRQFQFRAERENFCCVLVSLILQVSMFGVSVKCCRVKCGLLYEDILYFHH